MGIARNLERRLERLVDGLSATVFRGRMHPVDLANRLVRQADLMVSEGLTGATIPNQFTVAVSEDDLDPSLDPQRLTNELAHTLRATAIERGWRIEGAIVVRLLTDPTVGKGSIRCTAVSQPGPIPPWAQLIEHRGDREYDLGDNRILIGRADDADIQLDDAEVSRQHALIFREGTRVWLSDVGSANGTTVNGMPVGTEPHEIGPGDIVGFGPASFAFRLY
jgi:hypothetical protein